MAKFDIKGALSKATETVKDAASKVDVQGMADSVKNAAQKVDVQGMADSVKEAAKKAGSAAKEGTEQVKNALAKKDKTEEQKAEEDKKEIEAPVIKAVSPINAVKIIYYLMAADGTIEAAEEEKFDLICREIDADFDSHKEQIIEVCKNQLAKVIDPDDYYDAIQDGVEESMLVGQNYERGFVTAKHLIWDLLTIAYSDDNYNEPERKLMKYIVRKLNVPKDVFLEMESSYLTVTDIEKEKDWIKTTDRPYLTIEAHVKELEKREQAIYESVKALILL